MLSIRTRQSYMKKLGFYKGKVDGIEGNLTKAGYRAIQESYFVREKDKDGVYGNDTDILLINAYRVWKYAKNFTLEEFRCGCNGKHCTGYPVLLDVQLLKNVQKIRKKFGATTITSGMRCKAYNNSLAGSSTVSKHMKGKALDIFNVKTITENGRKVVMEYVKTLKNHNYTYCSIGGNYPNMGNAVHFDVK